MRTTERFVTNVIKEIIEQMRRPRLICVCGSFEYSGKTEMDFYKCKNCGGWMSAVRLVESRYSGDSQP